MNLEDWLLLIHIVSGAAWFGGGVMLVALSARARQRGSVFEFVQQMEWVGPRIGPPVSLGIVGTGAWMVILGDQFAFSDAWILGGLVGFVLLLAIGAGFHNNQYKRIRAAANEFGEASVQVSTLCAASFRAARLEVLVLSIVLVLMVFKPGL